jgi:hypothetical protein
MNGLTFGSFSGSFLNNAIARTSAVLVTSDPLSPAADHSSSWRLSSFLRQPDLSIGRGLPPLKNQQRSGVRWEKLMTTDG